MLPNGLTPLHLEPLETLGHAFVGAPVRSVSGGEPITSLELSLMEIYLLWPAKTCFGTALR